jgi:hypothetical protein
MNWREKLPQRLFEEISINESVNGGRPFLFVSLMEGSGGE